MACPPHNYDVCSSCFLETSEALETCNFAANTKIQGVRTPKITNFAFAARFAEEEPNQQQEVPQTLEEAMRSADKEKWLEAIKKGVERIDGNGNF
jgi:hypothetical protein